MLYHSPKQHKMVITTDESKLEEAMSRVEVKGMLQEFSEEEYDSGIDYNGLKILFLFAWLTIYSMLLHASFCIQILMLVKTAMKSKQLVMKVDKSWVWKLSWWLSYADSNIIRIINCYRFQERGSSNSWHNHHRGREKENENRHHCSQQQKGESKDGFGWCFNRVSSHTYRWKVFKYSCADLLYRHGG